MARGENRFSLNDKAPGVGAGERRQEDRFLTILRVGVLIVDGHRELCLIRNVSAGGLKAHVYSPLVKGQRLTVELRTERPLGGHVVWIDGSEAGIAFDHPVDVGSLLSHAPEEEHGWQQRMPRVEIDRMATLRVGARTHWAVGRDISQGGARLDIDSPLDPGQEIVLTFDRFRALPAVVRWSRADSCGVGFNSLIPFEELIAWLKLGD